MTLSEAVSSAAKRLDAIKPGWAALVPTEDIVMNSCTKCVLGWVFADEARAQRTHEPSSCMNGYYVGLTRLLRTGYVDSDERRYGVFRASVCVPYWVSEIQARTVPADVITAPVVVEPEGELVGV